MLKMTVEMICPPDIPLWAKNQAPACQQVQSPTSDELARDFLRVLKHEGARLGIMLRVSFSEDIKINMVTRARAAAHLTAHGYPITASSLAKLATTNEGPVLFGSGKDILYVLDDLIIWALQSGDKINAVSGADRIASEGPTAAKPGCEPNAQGRGEEGLVGAAGYLTSLGYPTTDAVLLRLTLAGSGPEHSGLGERLMFSHDSLLKWASTIERIIGPCHDATGDAPQIK